MAKINEMKFVEQHLEKVVLGVCTLILLYGVFQWGLASSPKSDIRIDGRKYSAREVDAQLLNWAERLNQREPGGDPDKPVYGYLGEIEKNRKISSKAIKDWGTPRQVMLPHDTVKAPEGIPLRKIKDILEALAPKFTEIKGARELINKGEGVDQLVFRGRAEFDRGELLKEWNRVFRTSAMETVQAIVFAVEIEKRQVLDDGVFGPVSRVSRVEIQRKEGQEEVTDIVIPQYTGKDADEIRTKIQAYSGGTQHRVLNPPYWSVWSPEKEGWTKPWIKEVVVPKGAVKAAPKPGVVKRRLPERPAGAPGQRAVPIPVVQVNDGITELWFHDTDVNVQRTYEYRVRILFVSPLYTYDDIVYKGTPKDAMVRSIPSGWSKWTPADAIPRTTRFFVTSAQTLGAARKMHCTVFTRSLGQEVSQRFEVFPGHIIGGLFSKQIKNPVNQKIGRRVVGFSTNTIAVHANYSRKVAKKIGNRVIRELICLDDGKLVSRILVKDMDPGDERRITYNKLQALVEGKTP
ncbi:MAG: hypothetical protein GY794_18385 [bacterium]|nr:hypothetical protein [bacterium]